MKRTDEEIAQACEFLRVTLVISTGNSDKTKTAQLTTAREALLWALGEDTNRFSELMRASLATPLPSVGEDVVSALFNLGCSNREKAEQATRKALAEAHGGGMDFEQLFRSALKAVRT